MRRSDENLPMRRGQGAGLMRSDWSDPFFGGTGSPWQMMRRMQEDMDRVFSQFFGGAPSGEGGTTPAAGMMQWSPNVDISSTPKEICLEADLPGVNKDDIDVTVQDHHLILKAQMRQEQKEGDGDRQYHRRERRYGFFQRVIPLPENVKEDDISCEFRDGVLTVHVPRMEQPQQAGRRIPVMSADQLPAETAGGRTRSQAELEMTEDEEKPAVASRAA